MIDGFLVVDKPPGITSHDVVSILRRTFKQKKIGHTGTLDPFATGVLPIALGEATKAIPYLDESIKEYQAVMRLGAATDTLDLTGNVLFESDWTQVTAECINAVIQKFTGEIVQIPPMFSAIKQGGVPLYKLARKGETVERAERKISIHSIVIDNIELPEVTFTVRCSRGTYVRTLADDIGREIGVGAHLVALRRTQSGSFSINSSISLDALAASHSREILAGNLLTVRKSLSQLDELQLSVDGYRRIKNGIAPVAADFVSLHPAITGTMRVKLVFNNELVAICDAEAGSEYPDGLKMTIVRGFNLLSPLQ